MYTKSYQTLFITKAVASDAKSETSTEPDEQAYIDPYYVNTDSSKYCKLIGSKLKTSLCRNFIESSFCPYGEKCQFAHGP